ncbi:MAG: IS1182 family transposase [Acidobacteriota bacterium]|nr:IS1182 family transposase [Acidobacteriota bacterium]
MEASQDAPKPRAKYIEINRAQGRFCDLMIDHLVGADHPARMIWEIVGKLDLSAFESDVASFEKQSGRAAWPPRLLVSVLAYGYTLGTGSAREIERMMEHEPGLRWLAAMEKVNHHTLSDFRRQDLEKLKGIFTQVLALLANEDMVDFQTLLQDGTKMRQAGAGSMHRRKTLTEHWQQAKGCVEELDRRAEQEAAGQPRTKKEAAQERAARERLKRMEAAMQELEGREASAKPSEKQKVRVSETEPEVKKMKHPDGGFGPSYNLQLVTEAKQGFIVGWTVSTSHNDQHELRPGLAMATSCTGQAVKTIIADGGYGYRHNIEAMAAAHIELVAPRQEEDKRQAGALATAGIEPEYAPGKFKLAADGTMQCPAGQTLVQIGTGAHHGLRVQRYQAEAAVCAACAHKVRCCPKREARLVERVVESEALREHDRRMADPAIQAQYKKRKQIAEYPNLRIKSDWKMDRFRLRGRDNVIKESFWMVLAFSMDRLYSLR